MGDLVFDRSMNAIQENLIRVRDDAPKHSLGLSDDKPSKIVELIQKSMNELGQKGLLGSDYKPLEVTGKANPEFIAAFKDYLAIKRAESTDFFEGSYKGLPDVVKASDIGVFHLSAVLDSIHDAGIVQKNTVNMKPEMIEALREVNHFYLSMGIQGLEQDLKQKGAPVPEKRSEAPSANDATYAVTASSGSPIKPV